MKIILARIVIMLLVIVLSHTSPRAEPVKDQAENRVLLTKYFDIVYFDQPDGIFWNQYSNAIGTDIDRFVTYNPEASKECVYGKLDDYRFYEVYYKESSDYIRTRLLQEAESQYSNHDLKELIKFRKSPEGREFWQFALGEIKKDKDDRRTFNDYLEEHELTHIKPFLPTERDLQRVATTTLRESADYVESIDEVTARKLFKNSIPLAEKAVEDCY